MRTIVFVTGPMAGHGGEETVLSKVILLLSRNYIIKLIVSEQSGSAEWLKQLQPAITETKLIHKNVGRITKAFRVLAAVRRSDADIVIALSPRMLYLSYLATRLLNKHVVLVSWLHFAPSLKYSANTVSLLKHADMNLVLNNAMSQELIDAGISDAKVSVIYNPVDRRTRTIPSSNGEPVHFLCIARISFYGQKNLQELFHACANLDGEWQLDIYGSDDSQNQVETNQCMTLIKKLGIESRINWHGFVDDVWKEIDVADALILTSRLEGLGMVLCEAASFGIPLISSDCPTGPSEIITGENGFLYKMGDVKTLSERMQGFVDRRYHFDRAHVKSSIERYYTDSYSRRLKQVLTELEER